MSTPEQIAIVGVGCRVPGADNLDEFWRVLENGQNRVEEIPEDRWNNDAYYDKDPDTQGKLYTTKAGLLHRYDEWDNRFFGVSDVEAERVDPQQRYVLECVHMAMEDGGITRKDVDCSETGVYIGSMNDDFKCENFSEHINDTNYSLTGSSSSLISARVSYVYNLLGPSLTLDTACSSALVAIHLGCQAIRSGDCDMAICGGVNSILNPDQFISLCKARLLSPASLCQTFSNTANGYARGEGCGIVILKKLDQALKAGNKIWAVISTGCNQDGRMTTPITAPSATQQDQLLRKTYSKYNIVPSDVQYIEAHGTGTPIGDPIEANCLGHFFLEQTQHTDTDRKIFVGSVKSNIGHLESAAGAAGLIKVLLMMKYGKIVPSLHIKEDCSNVNPKIDFEQYGMKVAVHLQDWQTDVDGKRTACVNSFGFGGTNAHAIIQQFQTNSNMVKYHVDAYPNIVCISASDRVALGSSLHHLAEEVVKEKYSLQGLSYTSTCRRDHLQYRLAFVASEKEDLVKQCHKLESNGSIQNVQPVEKVLPRIIFVFCGVGTSWKTMCKDLLYQYPTFKQSIKNIDHYLEKLTGWKMVKKLSRGEDITDPFFNHLAIFSCQIGMTDLLRTCGVVPECVLGQSVGEVAAAYSSGALTLEKAVKVIFHRSQILAMQTGGKMMVVRNCDIARIEAEVRKYEDRVSIAVYLSPKSCTISGHADAIDNMRNDLLKLDGVSTKELSVPCAYHSSQLNSCKPDFLKFFKFLESKPYFAEASLSVQHISTVTAKCIDPKELNTATYWTNNVCEPVRFFQSIQNAQTENRLNIFVEIGPGPVLLAHMNDIFPKTTHPCMATMKKSDGIRCLLTTMAKLYEYGQDFCWKSVSKTACKPEELPQYQFNCRKSLYISEMGICRMKGYRVSCQKHPFVKATPHDSTRFEAAISQSTTPFVYDHFHDHTVLVPGATYLEIGLEIGKKTTKLDVSDLALSAKFISPFTPEEGQSFKLQVIVNKDGLCRILTHERLLAEILISKRLNEKRKPLDIQVVKARCTREQDSAENYRCLQKFGFSYGQRLRLLGKSWVGKQECLAEVKLPTVLAEDMKATHFHPSVLDAMFQIFGVLSANSGSNQTALPKGLQQLTIYSPLEKNLFIYAKNVTETATRATLNAVLLGDYGNVIAEIQGFMLESETDKDEERNMQFTLKWNKLQRGLVINTPKDTSGTHVVITKFMHTADKLQTQLSGLKTKYLILEHLPEKNKADALRNKLIETWNSQGNIEGVVVNLHENVPSENMENGDIYSRIVDAVLAMKDIVLTVATQTKTVPVYILTEATQLVDCLTNESNVFGSELWGMVRCILWEMDVDVRLIDLQPNLRSCGNIGAVIQSLSILPEIKECALVDNELFTCELRPVRECAAPRFRKILWDGHSKIELVKMNKRNTFILASAQDAASNNDNVTVDVTTAALHSEDLYPVLTNTDEEVWPDPNHFSHFRTLEVRGYRREIKTGSKEQFVCCFPVTVSSTVSAPEVCTTKLSTFTFYETGLLTAAVVACAIAKQVPLNSTVVIAENDRTNALAILLRHMIKRKAKILPSGQLNENMSLGSGIFVLLRKLESADAEAFVSDIRECYQILTIRQFLSRSTERKILDDFPHLHFHCLDTRDLFRPRDMIELVPEAAASLEHLQKDDQECNHALKTCIQNTACCTTVNQFAFPTDIVNLPNATAPNLPKIMVRKENLINPNACYLLVGGLTGLGWEILQHLASQGAKNIVCLSRKASQLSTEAARKRINEEFRCQVTCLQADITRLESLQTAFRQIEKLFPGIPIRGVFHGGAVLDDSLLEMMEKEKVERVLLPKVLGSWNLHSVTKDLQLDFFILHSSVVSIIGNAGQANYAAGNAFMDTLAKYRRVNGLPGQSINWGALEVGMSNQKPGIKQLLEQRGILTLNIKQIMQCLTQSLMSDGVQHIYGLFKWERLAKNPASGRHGKKMQHVLSTTRTFTHKDPTNLSPAAIDVVKVEQMSEGKRQEIMLELVLKTIGEIIVSDSSDLSESTSFFSLGIDSMSAMSFVSLILERTNCRIPAVKVLSGECSVGEIAAFLASNVGVRKGDEGPLEYQHLFDGYTTFMQKFILQLFLLKKEKWMNMFLLDLEFDNLNISTTSWKTILFHVIRSHPQLRTTFLSEKGEIQPVVSPPDIVPDVQVVEYSYLADDSKANISELYTFDLSRELPIRFQLAHSGSSTILRMLMHAVMADIQTIRIVMNHIVESVKKMKRGNRLQEGGYKDNIDVQEAIRTSILQRMQELRQYWNQRLQCLTEPVSLTLFFTHPVPSKHSIVIKRTLAAAKSKSIFRFVRENRLTLFKFMTSLYQLLLYCLVGKRHIPVISAADMRTHVPKLRDVATYCVNDFLVVAEVRDQENILQFIRRNAQDIHNDLEHNAYPFQLIKSYLDDDTLLQHRIVMQDNTSLNALLDGGTSVRVRRILDPPLYPTETVLYVAYDSKKEEIELEFGSNTFSHKEGNLVLEKIICELEFVLNDADMSIRSVKDGLLTSLDSVPEVLEQSHPESQYYEHSGNTPQFGLTNGKELRPMDYQRQLGTHVESFKSQQTGARVPPYCLLKENGQKGMRQPTTSTTSEPNNHTDSLQLPPHMQG